MPINKCKHMIIILGKAIIWSGNFIHSKEISNSDTENFILYI